MPECEHCLTIVDMEDICYSVEMDRELCPTCISRVCECVECYHAFVRSRRSSYLLCRACIDRFDWSRIADAGDNRRLTIRGFNRSRAVRDQFRIVKERKKMIVGKRIVYEPVERNRL